MFEIYGTKDCIFCVKSKKILEKHHKEYTFIDVAENDDVTAAFFEKFPNVSKVPQITLDDGHWIGGYEELEKWLNHTE
jgi:glutaredoxin